MASAVTDQPERERPYGVTQTIARLLIRLVRAHRDSGIQAAVRTSDQSRNA